MAFASNGSKYKPTGLGRGNRRQMPDFNLGLQQAIAALEQKRDKYKAIKRGMMQELLTGKIRLV